MEVSRGAIRLSDERVGHWITIADHDKEAVASDLVERVPEVQLQKHAGPNVSVVEVRPGGVRPNLCTTFHTDAQLMGGQVA